MAVEISNIDLEEEIEIVTERWDPDGAIVIEEEDELLDGCTDDDILNIPTVVFLNESQETCVISTPKVAAAAPPPPQKKPRKKLEKKFHCPKCNKGCFGKKGSRITLEYASK